MMVNSMTGYGRCQQLIGSREIGVEIKSVNHRYFEFSARVPRSCGYMEEKLKSLVYKRVSRGKVDVSVSIVALEGAAAEVQINRKLAESYLTALRELGGALALKDDVTLSRLAGFSDIFTVRKYEADEQELWAAVRQVAEQSLQTYLDMRGAEGERLGADILARLEAVERHVALVERRSPEVAEAYRQRLLTRLREVLADVQADEGRVITEAAIFAEKTAVAEETVRLRSHIGQMRGFLSGGEAVGRKLDFLVQEMNREANTIGSKAQDVEIQRTVVEIKSEIEKIREQIQNVE